jgi:hypothetical protein
VRQRIAEAGDAQKSAARHDVCISCSGMSLCDVVLGVVGVSDGYLR